MQTQGHYVLNLAILGTTIAPEETIAITIGAILPDIPIFLFYLVAKFFYKIPERKIWQETYYKPLPQNIIAFSHSIPLAIIGSIICFYFNFQFGLILFLSTICHCLLDLPVHNDDAHRHFYPFSNYRFISPFSYWDRKHHAKVVAAIEMLLVLIVTPLVIGLLNSVITKVIIMAIDIFYIFSYYRFYLYGSSNYCEKQNSYSNE